MARGRQHKSDRRELVIEWVFEGRLGCGARRAAYIDDCELMVGIGLRRPVLGCHCARRAAYIDDCELIVGYA